jgi:ribosomal protein S18 acetylase RimI-like enzyme
MPCSIPFALQGTLQKWTSFHKAGQLGGALVIDAVRRAAGADPAIFALVVDAKDETAVAFYEHLAFRRFISRPMSLYIPIATALKAVDEAGGKPLGR